MKFIGSSPATSSGATTIPADADIFKTNNATIFCNNIDGYLCRDIRTLGNQDARWPFKFMDGEFEAYGLTTSIATLSEGGLVGTDSILRLGKVADPMDSTRKAICMRLVQGDPNTAGSKRVEITHAGTSRRLPRGQVLWIGTAFLVPSAWKYADAVLPSNPAAASDEVLIWQIHDEGDAGDDAGMYPNVSMTLFGGGATTPEAATQKITIRTSQTPITTKPGLSSRVVFDEADYPADQWQYWIFQIRLHWDSSQQPFFRAWRKIGLTGTYSLVIDDDQPNQYNNVREDYMKSGIYYYANAWTGGQTEKTLHSKGIFSFQESDGLDIEDLKKYMDSI